MHLDDVASGADDDDDDDDGGASMASSGRSSCTQSCTSTISNGSYVKKRHYKGPRLPYPIQRKIWKGTRDCELSADGSN